MNYTKLKVFVVLFPTLVIGGYEYIRHEFLIPYLSMEMGNLYITFITFVISLLFATWMFRVIEQMNQRVSEEKAKRAVYEERERLARELHDNIAQGLFFLNVKLKQGDLDEAKLAVNEIDTNLRQAIFNLRATPDASQDYFPQRLKKWLDEWNTVTGIEVHQEMEVRKGFFTPREEVQIFGIIQEAFTNIRKHSQASQVHLKLVTDQEGWYLTIQDNGVGTPSQESGRKNTFGLSMIEERAKKLGAAYEFSKPHTGGTQWMIKVEEKGRETL